MTTTNTCDVEASIAQSISLIKAGSRASEVNGTKY